ncbi:hypothetical protein IFM89_014117 [Coptis chinensis]|uniref:PPPDE domain-containing protein n=1 Tax=Coptis chinensis TaxID=261450 RepID=A0A835LZG2_9MAGN|nr:hypothetical protein IFM89_014117 [Coptis chinensis]
MAEDGQKVSLNVYDLSQGLARQLSTSFLGKAIEGIWHTGVVVYGNESTTLEEEFSMPQLGRRPRKSIRVVDLGFTHFLVGTDIPDYILQLPNEVLNSPMGALILPTIQQLETTLKSGDVPQAPQFRPMPLTQPRPFMSTTVNSNADKTTTTTSATITESRETKSGSAAEVPVKSVGDSAKASEKLCTSNNTKTITPASTVGAPKKKVDGVAGDPLGNARSKIQEEIGREFAAIMASGTLRASEAAALATRKVMERYGRMNAGVRS